MEKKICLPFGIALLLLLLIPAEKTTASETPIYFDNNAHCANVTIDFDGSFTVSSDQPWCYVTAFPDEGYFKLSVSSNGYGTASPERTATLTLSPEGASDSLITVIQSGTNVVLYAEETNILLAPDENEFALTITSNTDIEFALPGWISEKAGNKWVNGKKAYAFIASSATADVGNIIVKAKNPAFGSQLTIPIAKQGSLHLIAMQYNMRVQTSNDGDNNWPNRKNTAANFIRAMNTDIAGAQELSKTLLGVNQHNDLADLLSTDYDSYIGYREESSVSDEGNAIYYLKNRFTFLNGGKFWLSETPDNKSKGWDAAYYRIAVWVILKDKETKQEIFVINTHFDNTGSVARANSATLIVNKINALSGGRPVILTGDLNTTPATTPINTLKTALDHTKDIALTSSGTDYTLHDYDNPETTHLFIDYIFCSKNTGRVNSHEVAASKYNGVFLSDHSPVIVNMDIYYNP